MEKDKFGQERVRELLTRLACAEVLDVHDDPLAVKQEAFSELLRYGMTPQEIEEMVVRITCQDILDDLNDDLLGC